MGGSGIRAFAAGWVSVRGALAAKTFEADGEDGLVRLWDCFHSTDCVNAGEATAASLAPLLATEVSPTLGRAVRDWR
jgi:hypothetical protein